MLFPCKYDHRLRGGKLTLKLIKSILTSNISSATDFWGETHAFKKKEAVWTSVSDFVLRARESKCKSMLQVPRESTRQFQKNYGKA